MKALPNLQIKCFGIFYFATGLSLAMAFLIRRFALSEASTSWDGLLLGIPAVLIGSMLTLSQKRCGEAVCDSRFLSLLLFRLLGLNRNAVEADGAPFGRGDAAFLMGIAAGCIGSLTSPLAALLAAPLLLLGYAILRLPESGVVMILLCLPFLETEAVGFLTLFVTISWLIKVIRGKRILTTTPLDIAVFAFAVVVLFGGLVSVTPEESLRSAGILAVLTGGYFLTVNLVRTSEWVGRCRRAILLSLGITAAVGVTEYLLGLAPQAWLDASMFALIPGRCVSFFGNPNVLAEILVLLLPFTVTEKALSPAGDRRLGCRILVGITLLCLIFTWSRGGWIGALLTLLVLLFLLSRHAMPKLFCGILSLPLILLLLPDSILARGASVLSSTDSSISYRFGIWQGVSSMISDSFAGGIGWGESAFRRVYPLYSLSALEAAPHAHNLYGQILLSVGFVGLAVFLALLLVFLRHYSSYTATGKRDSARLRYTAASGFAGIVGFLAMGMTDYVWYNNRVFLLFFLIIGLTSASIRTGERERIETVSDGPHLDLTCKRRAASGGRKDRSPE